MVDYFIVILMRLYFSVLHNDTHVSTKLNYVSFANRNMYAYWPTGR